MADSHNMSQIIILEIWVGANVMIEKCLYNPNSVSSLLTVSADKAIVLW